MCYTGICKYETREGECTILFSETMPEDSYCAQHDKQIDEYTKKQGEKNAKRKE